MRIGIGGREEEEEDRASAPADAAAGPDARSVGGLLRSSPLGLSPSSGSGSGCGAWWWCGTAVWRTDQVRLYILVVRCDTHATQAGTAGQHAVRACGGGGGPQLPDNCVLGIHPASLGKILITAAAWMDLNEGRKEEG